MIATAQPGRVASQREVARRLGVSHTALQKAQRAGRIEPEADGAWDVEKVRAPKAAIPSARRRRSCSRWSQPPGPRRHRLS